MPLDSTNNKTKDESIDLTISRARWEDMPQIAEFIRSSADWYAKFVDEKDMSEHNVEDSWMAKNYARREFYLGKADDEPVGTVSLQVVKGFAYLGYIYLDVNQVGKGYGHQLMEFAKKETKRRGLKGMVLIAHPEAKWATKAYLKYGFQRIASAKKEVLAWNDGVLKPYYEEGFELYKFAL